MPHTHAHDTQATIAHLSQTLKAPRINTVYATIAEQARAESYTYEEGPGPRKVDTVGVKLLALL